MTEVIEILEMLGGVNKYHREGNVISLYYYIGRPTHIYSTTEISPTEYFVFTLEGFLEKYPYKVGDKVTIKEQDKVVTITDMSWRNGREIIYETIHNGDCYECFSAEELQPYKEKVMAKANKAVFDANAQCCDIMNHLIKEETMEEIIKIDIPKGYEFAGVDNNTQQVMFTKIQPEYPKTYDECCKVLFPNSNELWEILASGYKSELLEKFGELLICRDTYWKIAGEQMDLGKPWNQDYNDRCFIIANNNGNIHTYEYHGNDNVILAFPTAEMRDAFYENFKNLIEQCKELL